MVRKATAAAAVEAAPRATARLAGAAARRGVVVAALALVTLGAWTVADVAVALAVEGEVAAAGLAVTAVENTEAMCPT